MTSRVEVPPLTGLIHFFSSRLRVKFYDQKWPHANMGNHKFPSDSASNEFYYCGEISNIKCHSKTM